MSLNPKYVQIASDDLHWVFSGTPTDLAEMLADTSGWIASHVPRAEPSPFDHYNVVFSTEPPRGPRVRISGISATSLVTVSDYEPAMPAFAENFGLPTDFNGFWTQLDGVLANHLASPNIEFIVMEEEGLFFIHMQVIPNHQFVAMLVAAIAADQPGYIFWLKDTNGKIPRLARVVAANGNETSISMDQIRLKARGTSDGGQQRPIEVLYESQVQSAAPPPTLDPEPLLIACSIDNGELIDKFVEMGIPIYLVEIDKHIVKMYSGDIQPPP